MLSLGFTTLYHLQTIAPFVFFTTLLVYTGQRYYKMNFTNVLTFTPRIKWMMENKKLVESILAAALIGVIIFGLPLLFATRFNLIIISICAVISVFYVIKIGKKKLREVSGLKVFLITIVYFIIICILPFQSLKWFQEVYPSLIFVLFFIFQYLYILGITVLFDIPDITHDDKSLKTLAQIVGIRRTVFYSIFLIIPLLIVLIFEAGNSPLTWIFIAVHIPFYYFLLKNRNNHFYLAFFGEGILGLLGVYCVLISQ
jgi:hypothetical protein